MIRCFSAISLAIVFSGSAAAGDGLVPWSQHRALSLPIPMMVVGNQAIDVGTAQGFFGALTALGFECAAADMTRWRLRRVRVACSRGGEALLYEGGFPVGHGSVVFDRVHRNGTLLGGAGLTTHVRTVVADPQVEPDDRAQNVLAVREDAR